jgi:hypothetical protein
MGPAWDVAPLTRCFEINFQAALDTKLFAGADVRDGGVDNAQQDGVVTCGRGGCWRVKSSGE